MTETNSRSRRWTALYRITVVGLLALLLWRVEEAGDSARHAGVMAEMAAENAVNAYGRAAEAALFAEKAATNSEDASRHAGNARTEAEEAARQAREAADKSNDVERSLRYR